MSPSPSKAVKTTVDNGAVAAAREQILGESLVSNEGAEGQTSNMDGEQAGPSGVGAAENPIPRPAFKLTVSFFTDQGDRKQMEDICDFCHEFSQDRSYAYFAIFDGHGGEEAAVYAKENLKNNIVNQANFWSDNDGLVLKAIKDGFLMTHYAMVNEIEKWPKTEKGLPSTSGTTASIVFVRNNKLYIGHVGDSRIVLGHQHPVSPIWVAKHLTKDHKPETPSENDRIYKSGGKVGPGQGGDARVIWNTPPVGHQGPVTKDTPIKENAFLSMSRALGDLWSYNSEQDVFVVSPEPDVSVMDIDLTKHRCLVLASDGVWNILSSQEAVNCVFLSERENKKGSPPSAHNRFIKSRINPSKILVKHSLSLWRQRGYKADNIGVVTVLLDPPAPTNEPCTLPFTFSIQYSAPDVATASTSSTATTAPKPSSSVKPPKESHKDKDASAVKQSSETAIAVYIPPTFPFGPSQPGAAPKSADNHKSPPVLQTNDTGSAGNMEKPKDLRILGISSSNEPKCQGQGQRRSVKRKAEEDLDDMRPAKKFKGMIDN